MDLNIGVLPKLIPILIRHLVAYLELATDDLTKLGNDLITRVIAGAIALLGAIFALALGCVWILAAVWDTPRRYATLGTLLIVFATIAIAGGVKAIGRLHSGRKTFSRLREEWERDHEIIKDLTTPRSEQEAEA